MKFGFKVGAKDWRKKLIASKIVPAVVEIAFNGRITDDYLELFDFLKTQQVFCGLHAPAQVGAGWMMNVSSASDKLRANSIREVKHCIDIAADAGLTYVNYHAGSLIDYQVIDGKTFLSGEKAEQSQALVNLADAALLLASYGAKKKVLVFLENAPRREWREFDYFNPAVRENPLDAKFIDWKGILKATNKRVSLCLDIGHLYAEFDRQQDPEAAIFGALENQYERIGLWHLSTIKPPFNGTDSHDGFTDEDYAAGAKPSRKFIQQLFGNIDKVNSDTPAVLEPKPNAMIENYQAIKKIYEEI